MTSETREIPVAITSRHDDISDAFKAGVHSKIQKLAKYNPNIMDAKISIDRENTTFKVDISLQLPGSFITGKSAGYDLDKVIDASIEKAKNQIKRLRDRIVDHKARPTAERIGTIETEETEEVEEYADNE